MENQKNQKKIYNQKTWENSPSKEELQNYFGFVYMVERLNAKEGEKRYYWGKKQFFSKTKRPPLKGKKRKRVVVVDNDWEYYYGSSEELKTDLEKYGEENFRKVILKLCTCKWQLAYEELKVQMDNNVIFRTDTYNSILNVRIGRPPKHLKESYEISTNFIDR